MSEPILVRKGNAAVKIYATQNAGYSEFKVADYSTGKRRFHSFANEQDARNKAAEVASALTRGEANVLTLRSKDRFAYLHAVDLLKPSGTPLEVAALHYAKAVEILGSDLIIEAARFYAARRVQNLPRKLVSETCSEMLDAKARDGVTEIYIEQLRLMLNKFSEAFCCRVSDVTAQQVNDFLRNLSGTGRTRNNYRRSIGTLFKFAEAAGYVPKNHIDLDQVARARETHSEIEIFSADELVRLIEAARIDADNLPNGWNRRHVERPGLLPHLVLGAFAGLRTAEIQRQLWSDINLERGFIRVTAAKGNTAQKRLVPIGDNLKEWLAVCWRTEGTCCDYAHVEEAVRRLAERAGLKWKHNALRHSFISYRVALTQNIPQVSLEAGNSVQMVNRHYRELVTEAEAKAWFAICPKAAGDVVPLAKTA